MADAITRLTEYLAAAGTMQATHKGTPHTANDKPLNLSDLARVLAVATVPPNVVRAVQHFRTLADMHLNETIVADCDAWLDNIAALRGATETGE
jgi:hypothetical protein